MFTKEIKGISMSLDALRDFSEYVQPIVMEKLNDSLNQNLMR